MKGPLRVFLGLEERVVGYDEVRALRPGDAVLVLEVEVECLPRRLVDRPTHNGQPVVVFAGMRVLDDLRVEVMKCHKVTGVFLLQLVLAHLQVTEVRAPQLPSRLGGGTRRGEAKVAVQQYQRAFHLGGRDLNKAPALVLQHLEYSRYATALLAPTDTLHLGTAAVRWLRLVVVTA